MCWFFSFNLRIITALRLFRGLLNVLGLITIVLFSSSCGRVFFPIELKTVSRSERTEGQQVSNVKVIAMTTQTIKKANLDPYRRRVIDAANLNKPAKILEEKDALVERFPSESDPGPYLLGVGDEISFGQIFIDDSGERKLLKSSAVVKEDGFANIIEVGRIKAEGLTQSQLEDSIYEKLMDADKNRKFELSITGFNSKTVLIVSEKFVLSSIKYTSVPIYLESAISNLSLESPIGHDVKIVLLREGIEYVFSLKNLLKSSRDKYRLFPDDKILVQPLNYRPEGVLLVGETGAQRIIPINSVVRPTLSETLFSGASLNNITSDFSQIYVIRKKKSAFNAFHLDITDPARVSLASNFEMRPDDIVFVATQPLSLYSRTLSQILGTTGLTLEARDVIVSEVK